MPAAGGCRGEGPLFRLSGLFRKALVASKWELVPATPPCWFATNALLLTETWRPPKQHTKHHAQRKPVQDTSNEVGGDGDIPHPGLGRARRMQVRSSHVYVAEVLRLPAGMPKLWWRLGLLA